MAQRDRRAGIGARPVGRPRAAATGRRRDQDVQSGHGPAGPCRLELPPDAGAQRAARQLVRSLLEGRADGEIIDDAELVTAELVANAVRHAGTPIEILAGPLPGRLRVEVADRAVGAAPRVMPPSLTAESGRGLQLVEALTDGWGYEVRDATKTVWFEIDLHRG